MQISRKQKVLGLAAASALAVGAVFVPAAVEDEGGPAGPAKAPPELPDVPTDPAEDVPVPIPGHGG